MTDWVNEVEAEAVHDWLDEREPEDDFEPEDALHCVECDTAAARLRDDIGEVLCDECLEARRG